MDPDPPTRRIPPEPPPRGTVRETEYLADPELERLRDRIRSLTSALVLTALLAAAGLGVALYAVLSEDEEGGTDRRGASPARVSALSDRVDDLENRVGDRATKNEVEALEERLGEAEQQAERGGDTAQLQESIEALDQSIQALEQRVESLEQSASGGAETEP